MPQCLSSNTHPSIYTKEYWLVDQTFKKLPNVKVVFVNPGLFAMAYFLNLELIVQFGMMPEFGTNIPPFIEDIGTVVAHILKDPAKHTVKFIVSPAGNCLHLWKWPQLSEKFWGAK